MARQGCGLQDAEVRKIVSLLASTEMMIPDIAERMGCSRSAIISINRKFQVRIYAGRRSAWALTAVWQEKEMAPTG